MLETTSINTEDFFEKALSSLNIDTERKNLLTKIATYVIDQLKERDQINLNFICTHNSRRSQLSQVWAAYASHYFQLNNINSYSGGTAVTAFFRNTVKTLQGVGFKFNIVDFSHRNPVYSITYKDCKQPIIGFSKLYNDAHNIAPFVAITTCSNADENCPFITEAIHRFHLPFNDPKSFDNTPMQFEKYLEANQQIAGEIHFIFKTIKYSL